MTYIMKRVTQRLPDGHMRTHYMRLAGLGDGPITSPDQDPVTGEIQMPDDYVGHNPPASSPFDSSSSEVVATVGPIITGVTGALTSTADWLKNALSGGNSTPGAITTVTGTGPAASAAGSGITLPILLVLGVAGYAGYRLMKSTTTKRTRSTTYRANPAARRRYKRGRKRTPSDATLIKRGHLRYGEIRRGQRVRTPYGTGKITKVTATGVHVRDESDGELIRANFDQLRRV